MMLLVKLGLIPDPTARRRKKLEISPDARKKQLDELGIDIPKENIEQLNREMAVMAKQNHQMIVEQNEKKHPRDYLLAMRKLGLTAEEIHELEVGENPFLDYDLGEYNDYNQLLG